MAKKSSTTSNVSSPASTGGAGTFFEQHVNAFWLTHLLVRGIPPILQDCVVVEVHLQTERLGWHTDDFLIVGERRSGNRRKLAGQVKRTFRVSATDDECKKAVQDFWMDFNSSERFTPDADRFALITFRGTNTLLEHFSGLLDCARAARDRAEFESRLRTPGVLSAKAVEYCNEIQKIVGETEGKNVTVSDVWPFLRVLHVLSLDLNSATGQAEAAMKTLLAHTASEQDAVGAADATWSTLLREIGEGMPTARTFRREDLPETLKRRHSASAAYLPDLSLAPPPLLRTEWAFQGRTEEIAALRGVLLADPPGAAAVLGPAGIGKSTLTLHVLHDPDVRAQYGGRRFFVRLDGARSAEAAAGLVAAQLGVRPDQDVFAQVSAALGRSRTVLVLDNLETPWEADRVATEEWLRHLGAVTGLALVVSVRGTVSPGGLSLPALVLVEPLSAIQARALFLSIAPMHAQDARLDTLLGPLDGVPLAVVLLARVSSGNDLGNLAREWAQRRTEMLRELGPGSDRLTSWAVSLELSWHSPRMDASARRFIALLAPFPAGVATDDLAALWEDSFASARIIAQVGLGYFEAGRLRMLAPVREHIHRHHPPAEIDLDRACGHYASLARAFGSKVGRNDGAAAAARLAPELANIDIAVRRGLDGRETEHWIDVACDLTGLADFCGQHEPSPLPAALAAAERLRDVRRQGRCQFDLARVALGRSRHEEAHWRFEQALLLFRQEGDVQGEANCICKLGEIALGRSRHGEAHQRFEQSLRLFHQVGDILGEANCILFLGDVALRCSRYEDAHRHFTRSLPLFRQVGNLQAEANCIQRLGDLALVCSRHEESQRCYEQAISSYRQVGDIVGEANCMRSLGHIELRRSRPEEARPHFERAIPLYRQVGNIFGEADCILSLGDLEFGDSMHEEARRRFEHALALSRHAGDLFVEANCLQRLGNLAHVCSRYEEAQKLCEQALPLYRQVGNRLGEANCLQSLGLIALACSRPADAHQRLKRSLELYSAIPDPYSMGRTHVHLSRLAINEQERRRHIEEARRLWTSIDRLDLIATLDRERMEGTQ